MRIIGLTGGIASGKTSVTKLFATKKVPIIDCDRLARQVVEPEQPALREIVKLFGRDVLHANGSLNREKLAEWIFNNETQRLEVNRITHHYILEEIYQTLKQLREQKEPFVVIDVPLLIEVNWTFLVDEIWLVYCTPQQQLSRLMARSNYNIETAQARIDAQMPIDEKKEYADIIIDNSGSVQQLTEQFEYFWSELLARS